VALGAPGAADEKAAPRTAAGGIAFASPAMNSSNGDGVNAALISRRS
jgi:hypothetical protein